MNSDQNSGHFQRVTLLVQGALSPPPGKARIALALAMGALCHAIFAMAGLAMVTAMFFGMSRSFGHIEWPWAIVANAALLLQFPLGHSLLLTTKGRAFLAKMVPGMHGRTLATTTYAIIASLQLLGLFALWTPSGITWWQAQGPAYAVLCSCYTLAWMLLAKASFDAGPEVQSGSLGWLSLMQNKKPVFPDMPETGLFRIIRQPIYLAFALTLWTVPVWTPDQFALAATYTFYCLVAPLLKERRFTAFYGQRFAAYQRAVPYAWPRFLRNKDAQ